MGWDDNLFREAIKKKYAIQQQEADTQQAEQIARAPVHQAQAQYYGGANATELEKTRMNNVEEARKTTAMEPMWAAEARAKRAQARGFETINTMNDDLYDQQKDTARAGMIATQIQSMADASNAGSILNSWIQDRNQKTGESNPLLGQFGKEGLTWDTGGKAGLAVQPSDFAANNLYMSEGVLAREKEFTPTERFNIIHRLRNREYARRANEIAAPYTAEFNMW
jgi:hypothetical protein